MGLTENTLPSSEVIAQEVTFLKSLSLPLQISYLFLFSQHEEWQRIPQRATRAGTQTALRIVQDQHRHLVPQAKAAQ